MMRKWLKASEAAEYLHVSYPTLRKYVDSGMLKHDTTPGGQRVYTYEQLNEFMGRDPETAQTSTNEHRIVFYIRDSQGKQEHLNKQQQRLTKAYGEPHKTYSDKASGLNENRPGLKRLLRDAKKGQFDTIIITAKDRLTRFGYTFLEQLFAEYGVRIVAFDDKRDKAAQDELIEDMMSLIASFSGKYYKLRGLEHERMLLKIAGEKLDEKEMQLKANETEQLGGMNE